MKFLRLLFCQDKVKQPGRGSRDKEYVKLTYTYLRSVEFAQLHHCYPRVDFMAIHSKLGKLRSPVDGVIPIAEVLLVRPSD